MYRYVDEVDPRDRCFTSRDVLVAGTVVEGSHRVRSGPGRQEHRFALTHRGKKIQVRFGGVLPARVRGGGQVVVKGRFTKGIFVAKDVLAR